MLGELAVVLAGERLDLAHALHRAADRLGVGERAAEPALGHIVLAARFGGVLHEFLNLLLGGDKEDLLAVEHGLLQERGGFVKQHNRLGEIDDVDAVALVEDVGFHLGVPALRLMAEMQTGIKEFLEGETRQGRGRHIHFVFLSLFFFTNPL